jgi:hypothetical protein
MGVFMLPYVFSTSKKLAGFSRSAKAEFVGVKG